MSTAFYKAQGAGNDFLFFLAEDLNEKITPSRVQQLCDRKTGVGADGLVILRKSKEAGCDFEWDFYNSDGGEAEMCGNAARCATKLWWQLNGNDKPTFKTRFGLIRGTKLDSGEAEVSYALPTNPARELSNVCGGRFSRAYLIDTGVPHCVIPVERPWSLQEQAKELAPYLFSPDFGPRGANLTFIGDTNEDGLRSVTLERGVNDFTLSCGTGVVASAKIFCDMKKKSGWVKVMTPGGGLAVQITPGSADIILRGPAEIVFQGVI